MAKSDNSVRGNRSEQRVFFDSIRRMECPGVLLKKIEPKNYQVVFTSKAFAALIECPEKEILRFMSGNGFMFTIYPADRPAVEEMLQRRRAEDGARCLTIRHTTYRGKHIWTQVWYTFFDEPDGEYVYCNYTNVTDSKIYAERLHATYMSIGHSFYRNDEKTLGMFRINLTKNKIEYLSGKDLYETDSLELPYPELIERRAKNYPVSEEQEKFLEMFDSANLMINYLRGRTSLSMYAFSRRKSGRFCYVKFSVAITRHPMTGNVIIFISEREANKEKVEGALLDKILARQFDMVSYLADGKYGVIIGDANSINKGNIFPTTRNGIYNDYLQNQVYPVLFGDDDAVQQMKDALKPETITENIHRKEPYIVNITCKIGEEIYYKRFDFYTIGHRADFFILLKSDTTKIQSRQIEQNKQLKEALTEARQASVAKTAFLSRMSHEIRTPMNAIIGLDNIALHEKDLTDTMKNYLEKIGDSARYLLTLINDILDMTRIESGRMTLKHEEFSFDEFLEQIKTVIESQCRERELTFRCNQKGNIESYYIGDDTKLKQVLINILGNAVKFTNPGGKIFFSVECNAGYDAHSNFRFVIKDTGIGMSKEYLEKIFEPFSQEDATTTSGYGGSGLGLAITKNIVEMMNGSIYVNSEKNVGSTFTIDIPLKVSERVMKNDTDFRAEDFSVLIIDDEKVDGENARRTLSSVGISADFAETGKAAIEMIKLRHARRQEYNLILVDWKMPDKDGIEVTREMRKIIGKDTSVVILTAYDWFDVENEARDAGVDSFMSKPLKASDVMYEFRQSLMRKQNFGKKKAELTGRRILVAEDMPVNVEIMLMLLDMRGMKAEHAENGEIAVQMFNDSPENYYDAILMDVRMPVTDGLQATKKIRALPRPDAKKIPIIAMTANAFDEDVQRSLQAGMNAHLAKPVEPEHMYKTLEELITDD